MSDDDIRPYFYPSTPESQADPDRWEQEPPLSDERVTWVMVADGSIHWGGSRPHDEIETPEGQAWVATGEIDFDVQNDTAVPHMALLPDCPFTAVQIVQRLNAVEQHIAQWPWKQWDPEAQSWRRGVVDWSPEHRIETSPLQLSDLRSAGSVESAGVSPESQTLDATRI